MLRKKEIENRREKRLNLSKVPTNSQSRSEKETSKCGWRKNRGQKTKNNNRGMKGKIISEIKEYTCQGKLGRK